VEPLLGGSTKRSGMHPDPVTAPSLQLRLHARPESAFLLRQRLCLWLYELGATDDEIFDVALASTEAFANAIEHPRQPCADAIEVDGSLSGRTVTVTVRDYGSWGEQRRREEGGYGFPLMRQLMGRVEVDAQPDGTATRMQRQLTEQPLPAGERPRLVAAPRASTE